MRPFNFDPRVFISQPYIKCPNCGKNSFGVLRVEERQYFRRCKECLYPRGNQPSARYPLPELSKKIIYVDQFAVSNMMNALNPETKAHKRGVDEFYLRLFEKLDHLCKLQVIICPSSDFHYQESLVHEHYEALKKMYNLLSYGISFDDHGDIQNAQVYEHARNWISGRADAPPDFDEHPVFQENVNAWQDHLIITADFPKELSQKIAKGLRHIREKSIEGMKDLIARWQSEKDKTFDYWFEQESQWGKEVLKFLQNPLEKLSGWVEPNQIDPLRIPVFKMLLSIRLAFIREGVKESDVKAKLIEYLNSASFKHLPFNRIHSMLIAALARQVATSGRKNIDQGMMNDTSMISTLLPYCDAMFIDNACRNLLMETPLRVEDEYGTKVFSINIKADFLNYLDDIEANITQDHFDRVNEVYGDSWREPYVTMYQK
jgi:hypothetical protein